MFDFFKKNPLDIIPEYTIDGDSVIFQEVVILSNGIALEDAFRRSAEYFSNFDTYYKPTSKLLDKKWVKDVVVDNSSNTIKFSYVEIIAGTYGGMKDWRGGFHSNTIIQFKEGKFRYTMSINQLFKWEDFKSKTQYHKTSFILNNKIGLFDYSSEPYDIGRALRGSAKSLRSIIYHSTERPDEDW